MAGSIRSGRESPTLDGRGASPHVQIRRAARYRDDACLGIALRIDQDIGLGYAALSRADRPEQVIVGTQPFATVARDGGCERVRLRSRREKEQSDQPFPPQPKRSSKVQGPAAVARMAGPE